MSEATLAAARHFWITVKANSESFQLKKLCKNHAICDKQSKFKKEISLARTSSKTTFFPSAENLLEMLTTQKACLLVMLIISIVIVCVNFFLSQVRSHCLESLVEDLFCFPSNITKYAYFHMIPFPFVNDYIYRCTQTLHAYSSTIFDAVLTQTPCHHHWGRLFRLYVYEVRVVSYVLFLFLICCGFRLLLFSRPSSQQKGHSYQTIRWGILQSTCSFIYTISFPYLLWLWVAIVLQGRQAGKKVIVIKQLDKGSKERPFPHAIVAGIERL